MYRFYKHLNNKILWTDITNLMQFDKDLILIKECLNISQETLHSPKLLHLKSITQLWGKLRKKLNIADANFLGFI